MFKNAGKKLTALAKIIFGLLTAGAVLSGIGLGISVGSTVSGAAGFFSFLLFTVIGVIGAWLSTILMYAFGELCENVRMIREGMGFSAPVIEPVAMPFGGLNNIQSPFAQQQAPAQMQQPVPVQQPAPAPVQPAPVQPAPAAAEDWACPTCGKINPIKNSFCTGCGNSKPADGVSLEK